MKNDLICKYCKKPFTQKYSNQKFCTNKCKTKWRNRQIGVIRTNFKKFKYEKIAPEKINEVNNDEINIFSNQNPYDNVRYAILRQAAVDYKEALRRRDSGKPQIYRCDIKTLECFFMSEWGQLLSDYCDDFIIRSVKAEYEKER